jgi:hypothetical protein
MQGAGRVGMPCPSPLPGRFRKLQEASRRLQDYATTTSSSTQAHLLGPARTHVVAREYPRDLETSNSESPTAIRGLAS